MVFQRSIAISLLVLLAWVTFPPALWHYHEGHEQTIETFHCEHDSHFNHGEDECYVCDWHTPNTFLTGEAVSINALPKESLLKAIPTAEVILKTAHLPFKRGPPHLIR
jgi:hypothetical protein